MSSSPSSRRSISSSTSDFGDAGTRVEWFQSLVDKIKGNVAVLHGINGKLEAEGISKCLKDSCVGQTIINYEKSGWQDRANMYTYFILVGVPPPRRKREDDRPFFEKKKLTRVVIFADQKDLSHGSGWTKAFLTLSRTRPPQKMVEVAICVFTAPQPHPNKSDEAFFSEEPKLLVLEQNSPDESLGMVIMTRTMSTESHFKRIVMIKNFNESCSEQMRRAGKYSHIQSINGILLDRLSVSNATRVIQEQKSESLKLQFLIRYIHTPAMQLTHREKLYESTASYKQSASQESAEHLPMPLFVFGDNYKLCRDMYNLLSQTKSPQQSAASPSAGVSSPLGNPPSLPPARKRKHPNLNVPKELLESDSNMERTYAPMNMFNDAEASYAKRHPKPPTMHRMNSMYKPVAPRQFVLNMLRKDIDRYFAHLFFRSAGIYLVVFGLEDMMESPLIQYDNLFFWLNQIQKYVVPPLIPRVILVGTFKKTELEDGMEAKMAECTRHLSSAVQQMGHIFPNFKNNNEFIITFDLDNVEAELQFLCLTIAKCVEIMIERSFHFNRDYHTAIFQPFKDFQKMCVLVKEKARQHSFCSLEGIKHLYRTALSTDDVQQLDTLKAYAAPFLGNADYCLLRPSLIIEVLKECTQRTSDQMLVFVTLPPKMQKLPICNLQFISHIMYEKMHIPERAAVHTIIHWMKELDIIFAMGKDTYYIPYLASESLSNDDFCNWNYNVAHKTFSPKASGCTTLFLQVKVHLPFIQLFHKLIAHLLSESIFNPVVGQNDLPFYVKPGCQEVILPLCSVKRPQSFCKALIKYHSVQSVIEFRVQMPPSIQLLELIEAKIKYVFPSEKYPFGESFAICTPSYSFDEEFKSSSLWKLNQMVKPMPDPELEPDSQSEPPNSVSPDESHDELHDGSHEEEEEDEEELTQMTFLTTLGTKHDDVLKAWLQTANPISTDAKDCFPLKLFLLLTKQLSADDHWKNVGAALNLISVDEISYISSQKKKDYGEFVMERWKESSKLSVQDLFDALRNDGLTRLAEQVEKCMK